VLRRSPSGATERARLAAIGWRNYNPKSGLALAGAPWRSSLDLAQPTPTEAAPAPPRNPKRPEPLQDSQLSRDDIIPGRISG
jgi:hypothetical protein